MRLACSEETQQPVLQRHSYLKGVAQAAKFAGKMKSCFLACSSVSKGECLDQCWLSGPPLGFAQGLLPIGCSCCNPLDLPLPIGLFTGKGMM